eukprot:14195663-Alexandrium_andersonii.AAC.1
MRQDRLVTPCTPIRQWKHYSAPNGKLYVNQACCPWQAGMQASLMLQVGTGHNERPRSLQPTWRCNQCDRGDL